MLESMATVDVIDRNGCMTMLPRKIAIIQDRRYTVLSEGLVFAKRHPSTPVSHDRSSSAAVSPPAKIHRPKTAAAILGRLSDCNRVHQVEHEPTRCHNFEPHLPTKRGKPPPWQKNIEHPLVPFVVGPGYILSRSKTRYSVTIKDEFFDVTAEEHKKKLEDSDRDSLTAQLQQQISDLTLFLEEERLNHRQTKQRADEYLRDRLDQAHTEHQEHVRELEADHREEILTLKATHDAEFSEYKVTTENQINRLSKEVEFLQGAFESYKTQLHIEMHDKWKVKEEDLRRELEEAKQEAVRELKTQLIKDKNSEKNQLAKENHRNIEALRKEHKKELDALIRKFSNAAADLERLQRATAELEETKAELHQVTQSYDETCQQLAHTTRNLTDTKVRLMDFEQRFQEKITEVDDKYRLKLQDMMIQNTELKRLYVHKCSELYDEKLISEKRTMDDVLSAKATMESLIRSKHRANVSLALSPNLNMLASPRPLKQAPPKVRPSSAPGTRTEADLAYLSAGDTQAKQTEYVRPDHVIPPEDPETERLRQELLSSEVREFTKEDLLNTFAL